MNKRGLLKFVLLIVSFIITFVFYLQAIDFNIFSRLVFFGVMVLFTLTLFMYYMKKKISIKFKFTYDIILLLLTIVSIGIIIFLIATVLMNFIMYEEIIYNINEFYCFVFFPIILINIISSISDLKNKSNKVNDFLSISISLVIIITSIIFLSNPNLNLKDHFAIGTVLGIYNFLIQNYLYYAIMYGLVLIHKLVNNN